MNDTLKAKRERHDLWEQHRVLNLRNRRAAHEARIEMAHLRYETETQAKLNRIAEKAEKEYFALRMLQIEAAERTRVLHAKNVQERDEYTRRNIIDKEERDSFAETLREASTMFISSRDERSPSTPRASRGGTHKDLKITQEALQRLCSPRLTWEERLPPILATRQQREEHAQQHQEQKRLALMEKQAEREERHAEQARRQEQISAQQAKRHKDIQSQHQQDAARVEYLSWRKRHPLRAEAVERLDRQDREEQNDSATESGKGASNSSAKKAADPRADDAADERQAQSTPAADRRRASADKSERKNSLERKEASTPQDDAKKKDATSTKTAETSEEAPAASSPMRTEPPASGPTDSIQKEEKDEKLAGSANSAGHNESAVQDAQAAPELHAPAEARHAEGNNNEQQKQDKTSEDEKHHLHEKTESDEQTTMSQQPKQDEEEKHVPQEDEQETHPKSPEEVAETADRQQEAEAIPSRCDEVKEERVEAPGDPEPEQEAVRSRKQSAESKDKTGSRGDDPQHSQKDDAEQQPHEEEGEDEIAVKPKSPSDSLTDAAAADGAASHDAPAAAASSSTPPPPPAAADADASTEHPISVGDLLAEGNEGPAEAAPPAGDQHDSEAEPAAAAEDGDKA